MLYPIQNKYRSIIDLSGIWKFKIDPGKAGEKEKWYKGFDSSLDIAVPGSWNEQLEEAGLLHYVGAAWYSKKVFIPEEYHSKRIFIRIGSADYQSKVWINGKYLGENKLGFLPFEFEITGLIPLGVESEIIILVDNELSSESLPQGITSAQYSEDNRLREETNPPARFDFSPFGGIHRPVQLVALPVNHISKIKINTKVLSHEKGSAEIFVETFGSSGASVVFSLSNHKQHITRQAGVKDNRSVCYIEISSCEFWSPENPFLYTLRIHLIQSDQILDEYTLPIGIREIKIENGRLLLNNKSVYLKGFGKHEDFPAIGKGMFLPLMIKDFELMKWINANSFRTSHYPYPEEIMFYADKKGILVIDEVPAVSLDLRFANGATMQNHKEFVKRLIERDYNHPSLIMWALGNEPNLVGDEGYYNGSGKEYWKEIFSFARSHDSSRPLTVPNCTRAGINDPVLEFCDVISLNRYYGWYEYPGNLEYAAKVLGSEMDEIFNRYRKPVMFTEFGADTLSGLHSTSVQMFTEEYQAKLIEMYIGIIRSKHYTIGEQLWNFADFRTPQNFRRVVLNLKGIFTRERQPKLAAFRLKELWSKNIPETK